MIYTDPKRIILFDTTLRDGEQALPQSLSAREKMQIALALEQLGVDVIETGFPVSSRGDFESVRSIASVLKRAVPCGLSRAVAGDIDACAEALKAAERFRIHTFIATSDIHVRDKLRKDFDRILEMGVEAVRRARNYTDDVEFSCEDAGRTPIDHLCRMVEAAIDAGATTVNIPDTVGYTVPRGVRRHHHDALQPRAQHRQGDHFGALPQRPRHGHGQLDHRHSARRAPDRVAA